LTDLQKTAAVSDPKRPMSPSPAPSVEVMAMGGGYAIVPGLNETDSRNDLRARFLAAFGTADDVVAEALLQQLLNGLHNNPGKPIDSPTANLALALMHEIGPRDMIEGLIGVQMIVVHVAAMDASRRALHVEQTAAGRTAYLTLARKLMFCRADRCAVAMPVVGDERRLSASIPWAE